MPPLGYKWPGLKHKIENKYSGGVSAERLAYRNRI